MKNGPCEQPTKRRFVYGAGKWLNEPGRCDNRGRYWVDGKLVCGKHRRMLDDARLKEAQNG